eukprot:8721655-Lingulodinium_polyedra.AAC.1
MQREVPLQPCPYASSVSEPRPDVPMQGAVWHDAASQVLSEVVGRPNHLAGLVVSKRGDERPVHSVADE